MPSPRMGARFVTGLLMAALAGPVVGQPSPPQGQPDAAASPELEEARQKAQSLQNKIRDLQSQALKNNPELRNRQEALQRRLREKMADNGFSAEQRQRLQALRSSLGKQGGGKTASREDLQAFRKLMKARSQAQQQAMQDAEIQESRKAFREDLMAAMKAENPKAPQLISQLRKQAKKFRRLQRQQEGQPRGGGRAGQP